MNDTEKPNMCVSGGGRGAVNSQKASCDCTFPYLFSFFTQNAEAGHTGEEVTRTVATHRTVTTTEDLGTNALYVRVHIRAAMWQLRHRLQISKCL